METKDHLLLANRLLQAEQDRLPRGFAAGFRFGSILPDCNPFTYLRGIRKGQGLHGHNAEVTLQRIGCLLSAAERETGSGFRRGMQLGAALHYLADAFTYPHHAYYPGTLADHVAYEASLHHVFPDYVNRDIEPLWSYAADFPSYLTQMLALYRGCRKSVYKDCRFILHMCSLAFDTALAHRRKEDPVYESSDYNRPVSAVR